MNRYTGYVDRTDELKEKLLENPERESIHITLDHNTLLENGIPVEYKYRNDISHDKKIIAGIEKLEGTVMGIPGHFMRLGNNGELLMKEGAMDVLLFYCIKKQNETIQKLTKEIEELKMHKK